MNIFKNLSEKQCFEYLGYAVAILVSAYVASQVCSAQVKLVEGMVGDSKSLKKKYANPTKSKESLIQRNEDLKHELYFNDEDGKYKSDYEDIIIHLDEWADLETIKIITDQKCCKGDLNRNSKIVKQVNDLKSFKASLENSMKFLDSQ